MTPVLVTGSNGYLGGRILGLLRERGTSSLGVDRAVGSDVALNLRSLADVQALVAEYPESPIIHCAAIVPTSTAGYLDETAAAANLEMVENLASAAPRQVVFPSSMTVYQDGTTLAREDEAGAVEGYGAAKLAAEHALLRNGATRATILRLPGLFGAPRKTGVLFRTASALARKESPQLDERLPQWAAIHVDDAAEICIRALTLFPGRSVVLNAGYAGRMSIADAVRQLATLMGRTLTLPDPVWFEFDLTRLHQVLGPVRGDFASRLNELSDWVGDAVTPAQHA